MGNEAMTYDLKTVRGPRITGWKLKLVTSLSQKPLSGAAITQKMLADVGIQDFRKRPPLAGSPAAQPLPQLQVNVSGLGFTPSKVESVLHGSLTPTSDGEGLTVSVPLESADFLLLHK